MALTGNPQKWVAGVLKLSLLQRGWVRKLTNRQSENRKWQLAGESEVISVWEGNQAP